MIPMPQVPPARTPAEVDRRVELWHTNAGDDVSLEDYLGWSEEEYDHWVFTGELP